MLRQSSLPHSASLSARTGSLAALACLLLLAPSGCKKSEVNREAQEAPPNPTVVTGNANTVVVDKPALFPLTQVANREVTRTLQVTGSVNPDISREIPVLSLANGRVTALHVSLGETVHKGQLVMDVQSTDVATAFDAYLKAVADEHLSSVTLNRDKLLFEKGAIPRSQLDAAQDGEADNQADLTATALQLKVLGVDKNHPGDTVRVYAPASGVIIAQNTTAAGAVGITYAGSTGSFTIADLSHVWVIVDVYENDLEKVHLGQRADIRVNAFPGKTFSGTISDIGAVLDPTLRTAKVRIQVQNPGNALRLGMFVTATIDGSRPEQIAAVPATAVLQLHDRSYVFTPGEKSGSFRRVAITTGHTLDGNYIEVLSGLAAGQQIVSNALDLQNSTEQ